MTSALFRRVVGEEHAAILKDAAILKEEGEARPSFPWNAPSVIGL